MDESEIHSLNAYSLILVVPLGIVIDDSEVHPLNVYIPILVTLLGIVIEIRDWQEEKATGFHVALFPDLVYI